MMRAWISIGFFLQVVCLSRSSNTVYMAALNACKLRQSCSTSNAISNDINLSDLSCCRPCSCDKYCHERNLCCPDYNESSEYVPMSNYTQICLPATRKYLDKIMQYYFVRASCPADFESDEIKEACEGQHVSTVDDAIFATSQDGQVTYKNKHCALCHGETNVQIWGVATVRTCVKRVLVNTTSSKEVNANIVSKCELVFIPPPVFNKISTYCQAPSQMVSTCPQNTDGHQSPLFEDMCVSMKGKTRCPCLSVLLCNY